MSVVHIRDSASPDAPRFSTVTKDNHSAWIIIATSLGLACAAVFTSSRVVVRHTTASGFGSDDWLLTGAFAMMVVEASVILYGCSLGLGATMVDIALAKQTEIQKVYYTANLLWIIAMGLSKGSVVFLLQRINANPRRKHVYTGTAALVGAWVVAGLFTLGLQCNLSHPWTTLHQRCPNVALRWQLINAFDIITELVIVAASAHLVWDVQTTWARKASVISGFACRLPIIIAVGFRLATYDKAGLTSNPSLRETLFIVWSQTELSYSLICATIPCLLQFMRNLNTNFGGLTDQENMTYGSSSLRSKGNFPMSILRSASKNNTNHSHTDNREADEDIQPFANPSHFSTVVGHGQNLKSKDSMGSNDSQRMIITKDVTYDVRYD